jgi:hypothetical protein
MAVNFDAILKIGAEVAGMGSVTKLSDTLISVSKSAKLAAQENARVFSTDGIERQMAAATAASIQILDADKQVLASRMKLLDNDRDRAAAQNQMADLEVKGAELRRKQTEEQLAGELKTAQAKKQATQLELQRAQSVVSTAGAYGKITPEMLRQTEAARTANRIAQEELVITTNIVAKKREVADAQLRAAQAQAESLRVVQVEATRLQSVLSGLNRIDASFSRGFDAVLNSRTWQAAAAGAAGFGAALAISTKAAIDFETSISQVRKVMDGLETPKAIAEISDEIRQLSLELPISAKGFAEIYAAAGASGIAREEVRQFAEDVAKISIAFQMTSDEAGSSIAKMRNSMNLTQPDVLKLADTMNELDKAGAANGKQLIEFALRSGAVGQQAGLTAEQVAGFGAAIISAGVETEVAATSFNNMVKAMTRGDSMTERQIRALQTLGMASGQAATAISQAQDEMVRSAEDRRYENALNRRKDGAIRLAELETDGVLREAQRRMDEQLKILDQQVSQEEKTLNKKYRTIETAERRQTEDQLEQLRKRVTGTDEASQQYLKHEQRAIEDAAQLRMDAINERKEQESQVIKDRSDKEKRAYEESVAAFKQAEQEKLDSKKQGIEASFTEERALHDGQQKILKIQQDEAARKSGESAGLLLARNMVTNAEPTIIAMLDKIKSLPQELQLPTFTDFFGDEARGLFPMINNTQKLAEMLKVASDETKNMGSVTAEAGVMMGTTAAQMQLAKNNVEALQIEIGNQLLPHINAAIPKFIEMAQAVSKFAKEHPLITQLAIGFGALGAALVIAAPILVGVAFSLKTIAGLGLGATIAGWAGALTPFVTAIKGAGIAATIGSWAKAALGFVAVVAASPAGLAIAAVALGVVIFAFRDKIADAFRGLWNLIANPKTGFVAMIGGGWNIMMDNIRSYVSNILPNISDNFAAFFDTIIGPRNGLIARLGQAWNLAMDGMRDYAVGLVRPITDAWEWIVGAVRGVINSALSLAGRGINAFIEQINRLIAAANSVSAAVQGPQLGMIQPVEVPQFAVGGRVDRPTLIMAGEAGPEYIVPQKKVPQFIAAQMGDQGLGIRQGAAAGGGSRGGTFAPTIQVQTGPVQQQPDGSQWIRREDAEAMVADGVGQLWDHIQSYDGRHALGMA